MKFGAPQLVGVLLVVSGVDVDARDVGGSETSDYIASGVLAIIRLLQSAQGGFMALKKLLTAFAVAAIAVAAIGLSANAAPPPGIAGKSFAVQVSGWDGPFGNPFPNCYRFDANGDWYDHALNALNDFPEPPILGTWEQLRGGRNMYEAKVTGVLEQQGKVSVAAGGISRLSATAEIAPGILGEGEVILSSVGYEVESCP